MNVDQHEPGLRAFATRHRRPLLALAAVGSAILSIVWLFIVPERAETSTGLRQAAIRFGHPLCWALFALVAVLALADKLPRVRSWALWGALASYAAFLIATVT